MALSWINKLEGVPHIIENIWMYNFNVARIVLKLLF
jgi:hypothetical protein